MKVNPVQSIPELNQSNFSPSLFDRELEQKSSCEQFMLSIFAQQVELQKELKYLHEQLELQKQKHKSDLEQLKSFHALIRQISEQIRDRVDVNKLLENTVRELTKLLQLERCQIELYNPSLTTATVTCECSENLADCQGLTRKIADFPQVYQLLLQKQTLQSVEILPGNHLPIQVVSQLACPMFDAEGILGNIWLIKSTEEKFDEIEISLVAEVANECAIAIRQSQLQEKTKAQIQELKKRERHKNEFLKTLAQHLRTPITNINLAAQTLEGLLTPRDIINLELAPQLLQILHQECGRETKLINDLLTLTYLKIEPEPPTLIPIDLNSWLTPIVESFRDVTQCQKQQLNLKIAQKISPLATDITDFERIIRELLNHACQCTPPGESITVFANLATEVVELQISYSGVEIPSHELTEVLQPFYRFTKNPCGINSDSGLELALVKEMIKRLSGTIDVQSGNNQITFMIQLPLRPVF